MTKRYENTFSTGLKSFFANPIRDSKYILVCIKSPKYRQKLSQFYILETYHCNCRDFDRYFFSDYNMKNFLPYILFADCFQQIMILISYRCCKYLSFRISKWIIIIALVLSCPHIRFLIIIECDVFSAVSFIFVIACRVRGNCKGQLMWQRSTPT